VIRLKERFRRDRRSKLRKFDIKKREKTPAESTCDCFSKTELVARLFIRMIPANTKYSKKWRMLLSIRKSNLPDHWVLIPVRSITHEVLKTKFNGKYPEQGMRRLMMISKRDCEIAEINESIKFSHKRVTGIEEVQPKYKWISSHYCRR